MRIAKELSALEVKRLKHEGRGPICYPVGGVAGLYLQCSKGGGRGWLLKVSIASRRREMGLGSYPEISLASARDKAREAKDKIRAGIDPIEERKAARAALIAQQDRGLLFKDAVDRYLDNKLEGFKNQKHRDQWVSSLKNDALPVLGRMMVDQIESQDVLRVLEPIWAEKNESAKRLRGRIEAILTWATVAGHRVGENPARWAGNLKELLPAIAKGKKDNQPALQLKDAPAWWADLSRREGISAYALRFLTLTASRSGEVRGARWDEIDGDVWTIPAERMKMGREHRIALPTAAVDLLRALPRLDQDLIFPAPRGGQLSDMTLSAVMRKIQDAADDPGYVDRVSKRPAVPHGLRSTFRQWAAEGGYDRDMAEMALAHHVGNEVERAYQRSDMLERRREMMQAWSEFLGGSSHGDTSI